MRFDVSRLGAEQAMGHPVVNQRLDGVRRVVRFAATDQAIFGMDTDQYQVGHDVRRDGCFDGSDFRHRDWAQ